MNECKCMYYEINIVKGFCTNQIHANYIVQKVVLNKSFSYFSLNHDSL